MSTHRSLAWLMRLVLQAILLFGGIAVIRLTPGPVAAVIAATLAFVAVVVIAMYLAEKRWPSRGR